MKKKSKLEPLPHFRNETEEWNFWQTHDSTDYIDYAKENRATIEFDPSVEAPVKLISIRLPRDLLNKVRAMAAKLDVPYQSYIKMILAEKVGVS
ncbi:MAG: BrnA antitoxin family protein [Deltaproteobacteria bacterium]|nr:BrnA antitoxin family protein [Deltaproteobacteria bacterium]